MVPYKRFDLAIQAARLKGYRLIVAGSGPESARLQDLARGAEHVEFVQHTDRMAFLRLMAGATAFLFPGVEDFGITPIEALALGTPLLAYRKGGGFGLPARWRQRLGV